MNEKNFKIKQVLENDDDLIILCSGHSLIMKKSEFGEQKPQQGDIIEVYGIIAPYKIKLNGKLVYSLTPEEHFKKHNALYTSLNFELLTRSYADDKPELDCIFAELPEAFQNRIKCLRFNINNFDIICGRSEIEACLEAHMIVTKKKKMRYFREPTYEQKLAMAFEQDVEKPESFANSKLMQIEDENRLAQPWSLCVQKYASTL